MTRARTRSSSRSLEWARCLGASLLKRMAASWSGPRAGPTEHKGAARGSRALAGSPRVVLPAVPCLRRSHYKALRNGDQDYTAGPKARKRARVEQRRTTGAPVAWDSQWRPRPAHATRSINAAVPSGGMMRSTNSWRCTPRMPIGSRGFRTAYATAPPQRHWRPLPIWTFLRSLTSNCLAATDVTEGSGLVSATNGQSSGNRLTPKSPYKFWPVGGRKSQSKKGDESPGCGWCGSGGRNITTLDRHHAPLDSMRSAACSCEVRDLTRSHPGSGGPARRLRSEMAQSRIVTALVSR